MRIVGGCSRGLLPDCWSLKQRQSLRPCLQVAGQAEAVAHLGGIVVEANVANKALAQINVPVHQKPKVCTD